MTFIFAEGGEKYVKKLGWSTYNNYEELVNFVSSGENTDFLNGNPVFSFIRRWLDCNSSHFPYFPYKGFEYRFHHYEFNLMQLLYFHKPRASGLVKGHISLYKNKKDYDMGQDPAINKDGLTSMRPGKAFSLMFPHAPDVIRDRFVSEFNDEFNDKDYKIISGKERKDFAFGYSAKRTPSSDLDYKESIKPLFRSCMHDMYEMIDGDKVYAGEWYASGDFTIHMVVDSDNNLVARCVVCDKTNSAGPIYTNNNPAAHLLSDHLINLDIDMRKRDWYGAKFLKFEIGSTFFGCYLDVSGKLKDDGDHFTLCSIGGLNPPKADGYFREYPMCSCTECDREIDEEDVYCNDNGTQFCHDCFYELHFCSDYSGEYFSVNEEITVLSARSYRSSGYVESSWSEDEAQNHATYIEREDVWVDNESTVFDLGDGTVYPEFWRYRCTPCDVTDAMWHDDDLVDVDNKEGTPLRVGPDVHEEEWLEFGVTEKEEEKEANYGT